MTIATRQDSLFYTRRLPSGLQVLAERIPGVQSAAAVFWVCTGTRDERPEAMGISHFLEHMVFRRTKHLTGDDIDRLFLEMGAENNAGTWKDMTFYWAKVLHENVSKAIEVLAELMEPVLAADDFDQERQVILEEIARYRDQPGYILIHNFIKDFFGEHPLAWDTLGTPDTINGLSVEQMRRYWQDRYGARNTIFAIAGNFDWEAVVDQLERLTQDWKPGRPGRKLFPADFRAGFRVIQEETYQQEQIAIGTPLVSRSDPRYYAGALLASILGDDTGSRLFWALNQTGLAETAAAETMSYEDNGVMLTHIITEPSLAQQALDAAQCELQRVQEGDLSQDELDRAKAKLTSSVIIGGESTNERVMELINSWLTEERLETLEEIRQKIEAVTLDEVRALVADRPLWPRQVVTAVGPLAEEELRLAG